MSFAMQFTTVNTMIFHAFAHLMFVYIVDLVESGEQMIVVILNEPNAW